MKNKNIAMIAYSEYSRDARIRKAAETAVEAGYNVDFFVLKEGNTPKNTKINKVNLFPINQQQYRGDSKFLYIFSYLLFTLKIFFKLNTFYFRKKYKIIHVNNMPDFIIFTTIIPKIFGAKIILDIHDSMPEVFASKFNSFLSKLFIKILIFEEWFSALFANLVITVHEPYKTDIIAKHGISLKKIRVIPNFADEKLFDKQKYIKGKKNNDINLIFHGTIADRFGLDNVLYGLKKVVKEYPNIKLNIYGKGDGVKNILYLINKLNIKKNVKYYGMISLEEIPQKIIDSDIGIVSQKPSKATDYMLPVKLLEYIAMGIPVLTVNNKVINYYFNNNELFTYNGDNPDSFSEKLLELLNNKSLLIENRKKIIEANNKLNWQKQKLKYIEILNNLYK